MFDLTPGGNPISVTSLYMAIQTQQYKEAIDRFNQLTEPKEKEAQKEKLVKITVGSYTEKGNALYNHIVLLVVDLPQDEQLIQRIKDDRYVLMTFKNFNREKLVIITKVGTPENKHELSCQQVKAHLDQTYGVQSLYQANLQAKVVISADPDAHLNEDSEIFPVSLDNATDPSITLEESPQLAQIRKDEETVRNYKNGQLEPPSPILTRGKQQILFADTINLIQGKAGVHKSRLAAVICSAFLELNRIRLPTGIGLKANSAGNQAYTVVYMDTERNLKYQFPKALREILVGADLDPCTDPPTLKYGSLINTPRNKRLKGIVDYLSDLRLKTSNHLVIILDVVSDCVSSFNSEEESLQLADFLNSMVNNNDATVLAIIHENPGTVKARGHLGTELSNKASTILQISHFGTADETAVYKIETLKNRNQAILPGFHVQYNEGNGLLTAVDEKMVAAASTQAKVTVDDVCELLPDFLTVPKTRQELLDFLCDELDRGKRKIEDLLKEIIKNNVPISNNEGLTLILTKSATNPVEYRLELTPAEESE